MDYQQVIPGSVAKVDFRNLDALFIDLDDTLVDYRLPCRLGLEELTRIVPGMRRAGIDSLESDFHELLRDNLASLFDNEITVDSERMYRLDGILRRHGRIAGKFELEFYDEVFQHVFWENRKAVPGALEFLERFRSWGIPVVVITNGNRDMQERTVHITGISDYIEALLTPESSREMKPGTGLFEKALELTGAGRSRVAMIGDSWNYDILGAINSGITPVWINGKSGIPAHGTEVPWISSIGDLEHTLGSS